MRVPKGPAHHLKLPVFGLRPSVPTGRTWRLPADFVFGAATSSHQVEGLNVHSDWWRYERQPGRTQNFENFPEFARERKTDHWERFENDIRRMRREIGLNGYRFSLEWSRIEPEEGRFDQAVIQRYADLCRLMQTEGVRPCVTLFHWSSPDWIWDHSREEETGWYDPRIVERFTRFCEAIIPAIAPHADLFCTLNEPNIFTYGSYSEGILCPGHRRSDRALLPIFRHLLQCHVAAYRIIKRERPDAEVGIAQNVAPFEPASKVFPLEWWVTAKVEQGFSWMIPDALATGELVFVTRRGRRFRERIEGLAGSADFLGLNYYERFRVKVPGGWDLRRVEVIHGHDRDAKEIWPKEIHSKGLLEMLETAWNRYRLPIYITENGRAHPDDRQRAAFLREHLKVLAYARCEKDIAVRGYFWWSLLDNQEWAHGFLPRLGLYEVDFSTGERRLRDTGRAYAEIIREGTLRS